MGSFTDEKLTYVEDAGRKGKGLFSNQPLPEGTIIGMYDGTAKRISATEAMGMDRSLWIEKCIKNGYLYYLDHEGDLEGVEFINHSCSPNCYVDDKLIIRTLIDVLGHTELTIDYSSVTILRLGIQCQCRDGCTTIL